MNEAWDEVTKAAQALKDAMDKAVKTSAERAHNVADATKQALDTAHKNIDSAVDWVRSKVGGGGSGGGTPA